MTKKSLNLYYINSLSSRGTGACINTTYIGNYLVCVQLPSSSPSRKYNRYGLFQRCKLILILLEFTRVSLCSLFLTISSYKSTNTIFISGPILKSLRNFQDWYLETLTQPQFEGNIIKSERYVQLHFSWPCHFYDWTQIRQLWLLPTNWLNPVQTILTD